MLGIFNLKSDLRLPTLSLHLSPEQIGKDISPDLIAEPNLAEPFAGGEPNRAPITLKQMSPIAVANISRHISTPPPPNSHSRDHDQPHQHSNPDSNTQPKSRPQGIKRPHGPINHRAERKENDKNRHHKLTRQRPSA
ncbi:hypothetical protein GGD40_001087 [Paraburkholderia bryophila]|uniref:Uncharacterized protein n=1 Tax=Paraburkholderia bryophila TaxID=420952 RepID=A0A7Y9WKS7_9BURK|nr:hypothetical protein [Paraburkholderia bryophila]